MSTSTTGASERPTPSPIRTPPNFPVTWEQPDHERLYWLRDRMHWPEPITPMDGWVMRLAVEDGYAAAAQAYELPIRCHARRINTYLYLAIASLTASSEDRDVRGGWAQEKLDAAMARLGEIWTAELLPEIQAHLAYWAAFDLPGAALPALLAHLDETLARYRRLMELHFLIWFPVATAISLFEELYRDLFGQESAFEAYCLLQGFDYKTLESGRALWRLSRKAWASAPVRQILAEGEPAGVLAALDRSAQGRAFLAELRAYLEEYGQGLTKWELSSPSYSEEPTPVLTTLRNYLAQPDRDPEAERAALADARERSVAETRERLRGYPRQAVERFEFLLTAAQEGVVLSEDHGFWIDSRGAYPLRRVFLEFGRRFSEAGVLDTPDDVFYLTPDEVRETATALPRIDRRRVVAGRRAEMAYFRTISPPPALGTPPSEPSPDDPLSRALGKFFGAPPQAPAEPHVLRGAAGAPGTARGPACVLRSLADAGKLHPGDVLVTETTAPAWTPLFATAAAVVTDTGGILSHGAVVAREYGIPAVVGAGTATAVLRDGQLVEVDGDAGTVRVVRPD